MFNDQPDIQLIVSDKIHKSLEHLNNKHLFEKCATYAQYKKIRQAKCDNNTGSKSGDLTYDERKIEHIEDSDSGDCYSECSECANDEDVCDVVTNGVTESVQSTETPTTTQCTESKTVQPQPLTQSTSQPLTQPSYTYIPKNKVLDDALQDEESTAALLDKYVADPEYMKDKKEGLIAFTEELLEQLNGEETEQILRPINDEEKYKPLAEYITYKHKSSVYYLIDEIDELFHTGAFSGLLRTKEKSNKLCPSVILINYVRLKDTFSERTFIL